MDRNDFIIQEMISSGQADPVVRDLLHAEKAEIQKTNILMRHADLFDECQALRAQNRNLAVALARHQIFWYWAWMGILAYGGYHGAIWFARRFL